MDYLYGSLCAHVSQNDYVLPIASKTVLGGVKIDGDTINIDKDGVISCTNNLIGDISSLNTTNKSSIVAAINEILEMIQNAN